MTEATPARPRRPRDVRTTAAEDAETTAAEDAAKLRAKKAAKLRAKKAARRQMNRLEKLVEDAKRDPAAQVKLMETIEPFVNEHFTRLWGFDERNQKRRVTPDERQKARDLDRSLKSQGLTAHERYKQIGEKMGLTWRQAMYRCTGR